MATSTSAGSVLASTGAWKVSASSTGKPEALLEGREQHDGCVLVAPAEHPVAARRAARSRARAPAGRAAGGAVSSLCGPGIPEHHEPEAGRGSRRRAPRCRAADRTFLRGARSPTTSAKRVPARSATGSGGGIEEVAAQPVRARPRSWRPTTGRARPGGRGSRRWRRPAGRPGRATSGTGGGAAAAWPVRTRGPGVIVITSCTVRTVGRSTRGTRCFVPCTICAPARSNWRPLAYRSQSAIGSWPRSGTTQMGLETAGRESVARAPLPTRARRRSAGRRRGARARRPARWCSARSLRRARPCRRGRRRATRTQIRRRPARH